MNKDMRKLVRELERQGFEVRVTTKGHFFVTRDGDFVVVFAGTPSDWRGLRNALAAARRHGFVWPPMP